jgi:AcrR family transcriptional regulator
MGRIAGVSPEETRERLQDAAARVFERKGFEKATTAEIAREAGVSSGAIYGHYSTKAELLADALRCHGDRATASLFPPGVRMDAADVLVTLASRLAQREDDDTALLSEALLAARRDPELARAVGDALTERSAVMAAVIAEGQAEGALVDDISADVGARFALMLGLGSMLVAELDMPEIDQDDWNTFVRRFIGAFTRGTNE